MADEVLKIDSNNKVVGGAVTDDSNQFIKNLRIDDATKGLKVSIVGGVGAGSVTSVSVVTANGVSGTVATATTTPAITLSLGAITPTSVNGTTSTEIGYLSGVTSALQTQINNKQPLDSDLTTIAGLTPTSGNFMQSSGSAWASRSPTAATSTLIAFVGDSGSGGTKGLVPAPGVGDATNYLKGDGTWATVAGGSGITIGTTTITSGADTRVLYDNAGVVGEYPITGASSVVLRDANQNVAANNFVPGYTTTAGTGQTITLTSASTYYQFITGSVTSIFQLPVTSTLTQGHSFFIRNLSSADHFVTSSNSSSGLIIAAGTYAIITCVLTTGTSFSSWKVSYAPVASSLLTNDNLLTINGYMTLSNGGNVTTLTIPSTSATMARADAAQTFTGTQTFSQTILTANAITASANAATIPVTSGRNIVTNNSAATLTITLTTASAVNMQTCTVQILDFSAVPQTLVFVNTENSTASVPTISNGSTTLPLTVQLIYNSATSKWRCVSSA